MRHGFSPQSSAEVRHSCSDDSSSWFCGRSRAATGLKCNEILVRRQCISHKPRCNKSPHCVRPGDARSLQQQECRRATGEDRSDDQQDGSTAGGFFLLLRILKSGAGRGNRTLTLSPAPNLSLTVIDSARECAQIYAHRCRWKALTLAPIAAVSHRPCSTSAARSPVMGASWSCAAVCGSERDVECDEEQQLRV